MRTRGILLVAGVAIWLARSAFAAPNVVLITVDTLRADHLHCYGNQRISTPNIDRLAAEGTRFETVVASAPLTLPSHCSILTGTYPMFHGVRDNVGYRLDPSVETLAQILKGHGYATGAFVGAYVLDRAFGLGTGFDSYYDNFESQTDPRETINMAQVKRRGREVVDHATAWIEKTQGHAFFIWVHLYDAHDPYDPPPPFKSAYPNNPYDGEIAYVDQQVGRLTTFLKAKGLYGNTLISLTSDHGESLGEHRELRHGYFIYNATVLVPWIVKPPVALLQPSTISRRVRSIDIAPTLLQLAGFPRGKTMQGSGLADLIAGKDVRIAPELYSESFYPRQFGWSALRSLRVGDLKYIDAPRPELYELDKDPRELNDRAAEKPAVVAALRSKLQNLITSLTDSQTTVTHALTQEELQKLARLGYIGNSTVVPKTVDSTSLPDPKDKIDVFYLINRAGIEAGNGNCEGAVPTLLKVMEDSPNIPATDVMLGRCYFIQERYQDSIRIFEHLPRADNLNPDALFYMAASQFYLNQLDKAEAGLLLVLSANPKRTYAHKYLGFTYQAEGKPELAIREFESVLETSPQDLEAHGKLGFLFASSSRLNDAIPHFRKVVDAPCRPILRRTITSAWLTAD